MTSGRWLRAVALSVLVSGLTAAGSARAQDAASTAGPAEAGAGSYLNGFCLAVVAGSSSVEALRSNLQAFDARPVSAGEVDQMRPDGVELSGQMMRFRGAGAPLAFVDHRRGFCALVYDGVELPSSALADIQTARLPVGVDGALVGWRRVSQTFAGRPKPPKFFLQLGEPGGYGICAQINTDLRRRDQSPAAVVQLFGCRIGTDERLENG